MLCQCYQVSSDPSPSPILLPSCVIGAISWAVEERVRLANVNTLIPAGCPPNRLFVPEVLHSQVAHCIGHWAHDSLFACHPGGQMDKLSYHPTFLVAYTGEGGERICCCLTCLCTEQDLMAASCWVTSAVTGSSSDVVSHLPGFCHGTTSYRR